MIIGLVGHAGSGKDTVGQMILETVHGATLSLADPLKRFCAEVFDWDRERLWGSSEKRNEPDPRYPRSGTLPGPAQLTPRFALQTLGTEWGRNCFENVWIDYGIRRAQKMLKELSEVTEECGRCGHPITVREKRFQVVVMTDCRFLNEAQRVRAVGGELWRIIRPGALGCLAGGLLGHRSEAEQDCPEMEQFITRTIRNVGTLEDLRAEVARAVKETLK